MLNEERQSMLGSYAVTGAWGRALRAALGRPAAVAAAVTALVVLPGLGTAPWLDPPEGFHAEIAHEMAERGDWITPRLNGVRYFSKPPLPYWLMQLSFTPAGATQIGRASCRERV